MPGETPPVIASSGAAPPEPTATVGNQVPIQSSFSGRSYSTQQSATVGSDLAALEKQSKSRGITTFVLNYLMSTDDSKPPTLAERQIRIENLLREDLAGIKEAKQHLTTKKSIAIALAFFTLGITAVLYYQTKKELDLKEKFFHSLLTAIQSPVTSLIEQSLDIIETKSTFRGKTIKSGEYVLTMDERDPTVASNEFIKIGEFRLPKYLVHDFHRNYSQLNIGTNTQNEHRLFSISTPKDVLLTTEQKDAALSQLFKNTSAEIAKLKVTEEERDNILMNLLSGLFQSANADAILAEAQRSGIVPQGTATKYIGTIGPEFCTQTGLSICKMARGTYENEEAPYRVIISQNKIPLEVMKKSPEQLVKQPELTKTVQSLACFSVTFKTYEEAEAYLNMARPFAEKGTLFDLLQKSPGEFANASKGEIPTQQGVTDISSHEDIVKQLQENPPDESA